MSPLACFRLLEEGAEGKGEEASEASKTVPLEASGAAGFAHTEDEASEGKLEISKPKVMSVVLKGQFPV
jgi:hypothetical protein